MFFALSKTLALLASPLFLFLVALAILVLRLPAPGLDSALQRAFARGRAVLLSLLALAWVLCTPAAAELLLEIWEPPLTSQADLDRWRGVGPWDAAVSLGGAVDMAVPDTDQVSINASGERLLAAANVVRTGLAPRVVVSGGNGDLLRPGLETEDLAMARVLADAGVPESAIIHESTSRDTAENAVNCLRLAEARGWQALIIVTSAWHMPRAEAVFRHVNAGLSHPLRLAFYSCDSRRSVLALPAAAVPLLESLERSLLVWHEWLGLLAYRLAGRA